MTTAHTEPSHDTRAAILANDELAFSAQAIDPDEAFEMDDEDEEEGEFEEDDEFDDEFDDEEDEDWEDEFDEEEFDDEEDE